MSFQSWSLDDDYQPLSALNDLLYCKRLVLSMINLKQVNQDGFDVQPGRSILMNATTRKTFLTALTQRKRDEVTHPVLDEKVSVGLVRRCRLVCLPVFCEATWRITLP